MSSELDEDGSMAGRVAVVTGASSGIGAAIADRFLRAGARVHGLARRRDLMAEAFAVHPGVDRFTAHQVDVSDADEIQHVATALATHDPIDVLVCAAGTNITGRRLRQLDPAAWDALIGVNLNGAFYSTHAFLDQLRLGQGDLVLVSSVAALWPDHSGPAYSATKAGLLALARGAAMDEHQSGVRVTSIMPGLVDTPILDKRPVPPADDVRAWCLKPVDVAAACHLAVTLPPRANLAEMTIVATRLQSMGRTSEPTPQLPSIPLGVLPDRRVRR